MIKNYKKLIDKHDVISFDIFDTLLMRPYINPYHVLRHIERGTGRVGFASARMAAESMARTNASCEDITLDDIYAVIAPEFQDMQNVELEYEMAVLHAKPMAHELYQYARDAGKKIAIISDMYLSPEFLQSVLRKNGFDKWDWFYVSGACGVLKGTGNLYRRFLSDNDLKAGHVLHIGDNKRVDIKMARRVGMHALHIPRVYDTFFHDNPRFKRIYDAHRNNLEISITIAQIARKYVSGDKNNYWYDFGYIIGGPVAYGISEYIRDIVRKNDIKQLMFIARDGYTMRHAFDIVAQQDEIKTYYVYAQRALRARCLGDWGDEHNADLVLVQLEMAGINIPKLSNYNEKCEFLGAHAADLRKMARTNSRKYNEYLSTLGLNLDAPMMMADSGSATFSAQRLLSRIIGKDIPGIYSITTRPDFARENNICYYAWAENYADIKNITSVIEFIFMAPEAPVIDIENCKPVYQPNIHPAERFRNTIAVDLNAGCSDFTRDLYNALGGKHFVWNAIAVNDYVFEYLNSFSRRDRKMLGSVRCSSNASHTEYNQNLLCDITSQMHQVHGKRKNLWRKILRV